MAKYDVIIIGGGHAGCEASNAAAKLGAKTLLLTTSLDTIGLIACSPSFGGPGRGHLLREIDAMGGLMPRTIDAAGIHFRHSGKDSLRWAPFAICERSLYSRLIKSHLETLDNLHIKQDLVTQMVRKKQRWQLTTITGQKFETKSIVISAGTFLKGRLNQADFVQKAGRNSEISSEELTAQLSELGFKMGIFRTGTGPTVKLAKDTLTKLEKQPFDRQPRFCSFKTNRNDLFQMPSYKTHTNKKTISLLSDIQLKEEAGPRHCPSLIDKLNRFPGKADHPVFVQPEDSQGQEWFLNGLSIDFSDDLQQKVVNTLDGLAGTQIIKFGYSVTYRYLKSGQLKDTLESKIKGLFFAGQVTGSNGYEEAAASGLVAGVNAALRTKNKEPLAMDRRSSFIGTLISDITGKTITEPYRTLLSRAENYLQLRCDNADLRLSRRAYELGLIDQKTFSVAKKKERSIKQALVNKAGELNDDETREVQAIKKLEALAIDKDNQFTDQKVSRETYKSQEAGG